MNKFVEGLRTSLEEATLNMDEFLMGVTSMVMYNADTVLAKYEETNLPLTTELTNPWIKAKEAVGAYSGNALDLMNQWTREGGFFAQFNTTGTTNLTSPWSAGITAATNFGTDVAGVMSGVVSNIATNVKTASGELSKLYQQIVDTNKMVQSANVAPPISSKIVSEITANKQKGYFATATLNINGKELFAVGNIMPNEERAKNSAKIQLMGEYEKYQHSIGIPEQAFESSWLKLWSKMAKYTVMPRYYAKGTSGTGKDEWAITDEPQFGDELTMYATPEGTLSFMRAGSTVVPADLTRELIELPGVVDGLMNTPKFSSGINMISNAINKPEITIDVENFLKVDRVDKDTLPQLEAMMDKKINDFSRQLNYALKGKGAR